MSTISNAYITIASRCMQLCCCCDVQNSSHSQVNPKVSHRRPNITPLRLSYVKPIPCQNSPDLPSPSNIPVNPSRRCTLNDCCIQIGILMNYLLLSFGHRLSNRLSLPHVAPCLESFQLLLPKSIGNVVMHFDLRAGFGRLGGRNNPCDEVSVSCDEDRKPGSIIG